MVRGHVAIDKVGHLRTHRESGKGRGAVTATAAFQLASRFRGLSCQAWQIQEAHPPLLSPTNARTRVRRRWPRTCSGLIAGLPAARMAASACSRHAYTDRGLSTCGMGRSVGDGTWVGWRNRHGVGRGRYVGRLAEQARGRSGTVHGSVGGTGTGSVGNGTWVGWRNRHGVGRGWWGGCASSGGGPVVAQERQRGEGGGCT